MRLAAAPGVVIPLPGQKASDQDVTTDDYTAAELDKHAFAVGSRAYFDYIINEMFFVNLFSEFLYYPEKDYDDSVNYGDNKIAWKYELILELEPQAVFAVNSDTDVEVGLAANYQMTPDYDLNGTTVDDSSGYLFALRPNASVFLRGLALPLELKAIYSLPLAGKNKDKINYFQLQARLYFQAY
jgi:hypothetical protein